MSHNIFFKVSISILMLNSFIFAAIGGQVYQDLPLRNIGHALQLNTYGVKDSNELGIANIKVTAYPDNISTFTDNSGSWTLATTRASRIEFTQIPSYLKESPSIGIDNTSIQFINNGNGNIQFYLHNPSDFLNTNNPNYVSNIQQNGTHLGSNLQSLQFIKYSSSGMNSNYPTVSIPRIGLIGSQGTGLAPTSTISIDILGSIWGKAYQKNKKRLFLSSMLQRHIGLKEDTSTLYVIDYSSNSANDSNVNNFSLQGRVPSNNIIPIDLGTINRSNHSDYNLSALPTALNIDLDAYSKVGKVSYGGIDIDDNTNTLWLVNLHQKGIISLDISGDFNSLSSSTINQYLIENLPNVPTCNEGELRPWGLKIHEGEGYLGTICDANSSKSKSDLSAQILKFSLTQPKNGFENILTFDLNYTKEFKGWHAWEDVHVDDNRTKFHHYAQPILSDIEFDKYNNMYLSFIDRHATQKSVLNYSAIAGTNSDFEYGYSAGELLKICYSNGIYTKEGTGSCLTSNYTDSSNTIHEFFNDLGAGGAKESSMGGLAILKGSGQILVTSLDPHPENIIGDERVYWNSHGVNTLSLNNGSIQNWYATVMTRGNGLTSKANGIGDIELITEGAPIEVGNRIWQDANNNGLQDYNEDGLSDINLTLVCQGSIVAEATSNSNGNYIFSNNPNGINSESHIYAIPELVENNENNCSIQIINITGANQQSTLKGYSLTSTNQGQSNLIDSDGIIDNSNALIAIAPIEINIVGTNNHSFDIGFKAIDCQEMLIKDDTQPANELNAITTIDVLNNDEGSKTGQEIKFLSLSEGKNFWESGSNNISSVTTLDTLTISGEGTWSVVNNKIIFTALTSFDGKVPTPVYYIVKGKNCTSATEFSNVAQVAISTPCHCPTYSTKSVDTLNLLSILFLLLFTLGISFFNIEKKFN